MGAPLTISFFMLDSKKEKKYKKILFFLKKNKKKAKALFNILENEIVNHSIGQIKAGAQIIQIFDTWANVAKGKDLKMFSIDPIKRICTKIKKKVKKTFIIIFPRNVGREYINYIYKDVDCISVGEDVTKKETYTVVYSLFMHYDKLKESWNNNIDVPIGHTNFSIGKTN